MTRYSDFTRPLLVRETYQQVLDKIKRVTRRLALPDADPTRPPWRVDAYSKLYRRHPRAGGEPIGIALIQSCQLENLGDITPRDVKLEGFAGRTPSWFVEMFCELNNIPINVKRRLWRVGFELVQVL